jgi:hypothetical protein
MGDFYVGLDLGQVSDYTAMAIVERTEPAAIQSPTPGGLPIGMAAPARAASRPEARLDVVHLERFPLGTPYPTMVEHVAAMMGRPEIAAPTGWPRLVVDATGVGRPVVDLFLKARMPAILLPLSITGGDAWRREGNNYWVAKRLLVSVVQATLQSGRLKVVPGLGLAEVLKKELFAFKVKISVAANETYGAADIRDGEHDDLVLAVAMAAWMAENVTRSGPALVGGPDRHLQNPLDPRGIQSPRPGQIGPVRPQFPQLPPRLGMPGYPGGRDPFRR